MAELAAGRLVIEVHHYFLLCWATFQLADLRGKVAVGEASLQEAQQETLSLKEEVARRKQHGEILLARIRFLKVCVRVIGPTCVRHWL